MPPLLPRMAACLVLLALPPVVASGCGAAGAPRVRRVMDGRVHVGPWVSPYAYEVYVRAELARAGGDLAAALELHREAIASAPDDPFLLANLADLLGEMGRLDEASRVVDDGLAAHPDSEALHLARGDLRWRQGQRIAALDAYGAAARVAPASDEGPRALADALERLGRRPEAELVLERFVRRQGAATPRAVRALLRLAASRGDERSIAPAVRALGRAGLARRSDLRALAHAVAAEDPALAATLHAYLVRSAPGDVVARVDALRAALALGDLRSVEALQATTDRLPPQLEARALLLRGDAATAAEVLADADATEAAGELRALRGCALSSDGRLAPAIAELAAVPPGTSAFVAARLCLADAVALAAGEPAAVATLRLARRELPADGMLAWALVERLLAEGDEAGAAAVVGSLEGADAALVRARWLDRTGAAAEVARAWQALDPARLGAVERQRALAERALARGSVGEAAARMLRASRWSPADRALGARTAEVLWGRDPAAAQALARSTLALPGGDGEVRRRLDELAARPLPPARRGATPALRARRGVSGP